jgi:hypothetical protein
MLSTLEFCIHLNNKLVPRAHKILWKSLAPFRINSGVGSIQLLINRWRHVEIQLNNRKYQTILEKIPNLVFHSSMACASLGKSLRPIQHRNAYEPYKPWEPKCLVIVTWEGFYWFVKQVCTAYAQMAWKFFLQACIPKLWPHTRS